VDVGIALKMKERRCFGEQVARLKSIHRRSLNPAANPLAHLFLKSKGVKEKENEE
jgi:hypothetical protein